MKGKRKICILFIIILLSSILSGCYDSVEVDDLAYVIAIGVDKGIMDNLRITLQFALPLNMGTGGEVSGGGGSGGEDDENKTVYNLTMEAPSVLSGINMANNIVSKQINLSHTKLIVFSKELALEGIGDDVIRLSRIRALRPNTNILVSRDGAEKFLKAVTPQLSINTAKYYEQGNISHERIGVTISTQLHDVSKLSRSLGAQPVISLAGISKYESSGDFGKTDTILGENRTSNDASQNKSHDISQDEFKAGEIPRVGKNRAEIRGMAAFSGGKMVGELDGNDTVFYIMVTGDFYYNNITVEDPENSKNVVVLTVKKNRNPVHQVEIRDGKPEISVKVFLEADIAAIGETLDYQAPENVHVLEKRCENIIRKGIMELLYKTSKEYGSDIFGFGNIAAKKYLTWSEWEKSDWLSNYKNATFNVDVNLVIRRPGLTVRSVPIVSSKGDEH